MPVTVKLYQNGVKLCEWSNIQPANLSLVGYTSPDAGGGGPKLQEDQPVDWVPVESAGVVRIVELDGNGSVRRFHNDPVFM